MADQGETRALTPNTSIARVGYDAETKTTLYAVRFQGEAVGLLEMQPTSDGTLAHWTPHHLDCSHIGSGCYRVEQAARDVILARETLVKARGRGAAAALFESLDLASGLAAIATAHAEYERYRAEAEALLSAGPSGSDAQAPESALVSANVFDDDEPPF